MTFTFTRWRHGGWYVHEVCYPDGAIGCVSNNYADKKWRIACHPAEFDNQPTFPTRQAAAEAEYLLANSPEVPQPRQQSRTQPVACDLPVVLENIHE